MTARTAGADEARRRDATPIEFAAVYMATRARVFAVCLHITLNKSDAEDACQEAFASVHRALPTFRGEARVTTWVYRIAVRAALDLRARSRKRGEEPLDLALDVADGHSVEDDASWRLQMDHVQRALGTLSADHRIVLGLVAGEELSLTEIADVLGVPEGTVASRVARARLKLVQAMGLTSPRAHATRA
jgi:RNA polymerase sigma-70 factor (ECF subfamily)